MTNIVSVLIWVLTVCKGYQQTTKELKTNNVVTLCFTHNLKQIHCYEIGKLITVYGGLSFLVKLSDSNHRLPFPPKF